MARRNYIFDSIRQVFHRYGYQQIETPAMENLTTLTGKYGDEGDQLLFKIMNSRLHESKKKDELLKEFQTSLDQNINSEILTERALRYDLTVPFARYVVMHQHEITFPFKRFQVQPVWRADRPQKGRYREFYQCDVDVIGSNSLLNEVELIHIMEDVFTSLVIPVTIKMNNRKILTGIAELIGAEQSLRVGFPGTRVPAGEEAQTELDFLHGRLSCVEQRVGGADSAFVRARERLEACAECHRLL